MANVRIPTPLRKLTNDLEVVSAAGANVGEVLENLEKAFPGMRERLYDAQGSVRRTLLIYVNDEDIREQQELATPIKDNDEVSLIPAYAGG